MGKYIPLIIGGIFLLFVLVGMFWGMIRGLKKSTFRLSWILVTSVVLFFVTPLITLGIMKIDLSFLNIVLNGTKVTSINHFVEVFLATIPEFGPVLAKSPKTIEMILALVSIFINAFIYVIMFWIAKIALWPLWAVLSAAFIKRRDAHGNKKSKHRLFGLMVGGVTGVVVGATTLMPVMGLVNMVSEVETETRGTYSKKVTNAETGLEEEVDVEGGQISQLMGEEVVKYINAYSDSFVAKMFKYTGIEFINNATFSGLSSATIDETRIVLKDEVKTIFKTINSFNTLTGLYSENLTQEQLAKLLNSSKTLVDDVFNINIINAIGDNVLPLVMDEMINNPNFIIQMPKVGINIFDDAIKQGFNDLKEFKFSSLKTEIISFIEAAEILNNAGVFEKLANSGSEVNFQEITQLLNPEVVENFNNKIFSMKTMGTFMPIVVNSGLTYLAETLEADGFVINSENGSAESVKTWFNGITNTVFAISNSLDLDSEYYITETTLPLMGKLLDAIKSYDGLSAGNYEKLINAAETKIKNAVLEAFNEVSEDMDGVKNEVVNALGNLSQIGNYENDFTLINNAYSDITEVLDGFTGEEPKLKLIEMGSVLDSLKQTQLFGSAVNPIVKEILNLVKDFVPTEFEDFNPIIDRVKLNVSNVTNWKNEFTILNDFVFFAGDMFASEDLQTDVLAEDSTLLEDLGSSINDLNGSVLFGSEVKNIVKVMLDQITSFETDNEDMLSTTINKIKTNIDNATTLNWEFELKTLKTLFNGLLDIADEDADSTVITETGATLDDILLDDSVLVTEDVVKSIIVSTIDQLVGDVDAGSDLDNVVTEIKTSLTETNGLCYEHELTALNSVFNQLNDLDTSTENFYADFGEILDSYDKTYGSTPSIVVSNARPKIVTMVINEVDTTSMDADMVAIVNKIKDSVNPLEQADKQNKYKLEFMHIKTFVDKVNNLTQVDVATFNFAEFGTMLDGFNTSILLKPVRADVLNFVANKAQSSLTSSVSEISTAITEILTHTKTLSAKAELGQLTYNEIFTDLGEVKDLTDGLASVEVTRTTDGFNAIEQLGVKLNGLKELVVVPNVAVVRIAQYATGQIVGDNGIKAIIPTPQNDSERVVLENILNTALSGVEPINTKYVNYLANPDSTTFDFATDFASIKSLIEVADQALTSAGK